MAWTIGPSRTYSDLDTEKHYNASFAEGEIGCITVTFAYSGEVRVYTDGDTDTVGFLSTSPNIKSDTGRPYPESSILAEDDDSGGDSNFDFTCDVEKGTVYYIWYRLYRDDFSGSIPLHIIPPENDIEEPYIPNTGDMSLTSSVDGTDVTLKITGFDTDYDGEWVTSWSVSSSDDDILDSYEISSEDNDTLGTYKKIYLSADNGLKPDTKYTVIAIIEYLPDTDWSGQKILVGSFTTGGTPSPDRPAQFAWTYTKTKGGTFNLTADEWCGLLDNIKAVMEYKGLTTPSSGTGLAQFYYPSKGEEFEAYMYNQVMYQLWMLGAAEYTAVSPDNPVTADGLNDLVKKINSVN